MHEGPSRARDVQTSFQSCKKPPPGPIPSVMDIREAGVGGWRKMRASSALHAGKVIWLEFVRLDASKSDKTTENFHSRGYKRSRKRTSWSVVWRWNFRCPSCGHGQGMWCDKGLN